MLDKDHNASSAQSQISERYKERHENIFLGNESKGRLEIGEGEKNRKKKEKRNNNFREMLKFNAKEINILKNLDSYRSKKIKIKINHSDEYVVYQKKSKKKSSKEFKNFRTLQNLSNIHENS
jgi:hypothetical protein